MDARYLKSISLPEALPEGSYLNGLPAVRWLAAGHVLPLDSDVTFFVGENGTGKSTLLEAAAVAFGFNAEGGTRNFHFSTAATHSPLWEHLLLTKGLRPKDGFFLRAESFYNLASDIDRLDEGMPPGMRLIERYGGVSLHEQSHGESFLSLMQNRFGGHGLYLLDEPEAALSPTRLLSLLVLLHDLCAAGSQFVIATHSPILMAYPGACLYEFTEQGIRRADYRDTAHYQLTRRFLDDPDRMLAQLLGREPDDG